MTIGDICYPDGALKDWFVIGTHRLKGGKPKSPEPPKRPDHYTDACYCPKCTLYDGRRIPKPKQPPAARHLLILPEMKPLLTEWIGQIRARVGELFGPDTPLWLSRKMRARVTDPIKPRASPASNIGRSSPTPAKRWSCLTSIGTTLGHTAAAKRS